MPKEKKLPLKDRDPRFAAMNAEILKMQADMDKAELEAPKDFELPDSYEPFDEEEVDEFPKTEGLEDGSHKTFYDETTQTRWEFSTKSQLLEGLAQNYYPNGVLKRELTFDQGVMHGADIHYTSNSKKHMEVCFDKGILNGVCKLYKNGNPTMETEMIAGKKGDWVKNFHVNGGLGTLIRYKNGKMDGVMEIFDLDGAKQGLITYKDGMKEGLQVFYYPNGKIQSETVFINDQEDGEAKTYYPSGILMQIDYYEKGKRLDHTKIYDQEGRLLMVQ